MRFTNKLVEEAYERMYAQELPYSVSTSFSGKFRAYNANVKLIGTHISFNLSKEWRTVNTEIAIGLIQELLNKIHKTKQKTTNIELYHSFIKNLHLSAPKSEQDSRLLRLFHQVNEQYFQNELEMTNLVWGNETKRKLATYDYQTDTITVSSIYADAPDELLKYLLYHEMLHKHFKFTPGKRSVHHSKAFREREKEFENYATVERAVQRYVSRPWYKRIL